MLTMSIPGATIAHAAVLNPHCKVGRARPSMLGRSNSAVSSKTRMLGAALGITRPLAAVASEID